MARKATRKKAAKRKTAARKTAKRKSAATKKVARKAPARKRTAKKVPARKKAARKVAARKTPARKTAARKAPARRPAGAGGLAAALALRLELEELYAAYGDTLDHGDIGAWPDFFTDDCLYKLISKENYDLGLPLGTMFAEKRGGLEDRVVSVRKTSVYHERALTHLITGVRVLGEARGVIEATANYAVLETLPNQYTRVLNSGRYVDKLRRVGGRLRFAEKLCIFDSALVPASIIYPI